MELHVSLVCSVPNGRWVEYTPHLDGLTGNKILIRDGFAYALTTPGPGIDWDWSAIDARRLNRHTANFGGRASSISGARE